MFLRLLMIMILGLPSLLKGATLDFASWDPESEPIHLTRGWSFYWQEFLLPGQTPQREPLELQDELCWQKIVNPNTGEYFPSFGFGTYKLTMRGLKGTREGLEFFMRSAATAYEVDIYPENEPENYVRLKDGVVGRTALTSIPQALPRNITFHPEEKDGAWIILIRVSNFHHVRSGLWQPPDISKPAVMVQKNQFEREGLILSIGMVVIIGIYNLMIFLRSRRDFSTLGLAFFCLMVAVRAVATTDLIAYFYPTPSLFLYKLKYAIEYSTIVFAPFAYAIFMHYAFRRPSWSFMPKIWLAIAGSVGGFILITEPGTYTRGVSFYQILAMSFVAQIFYLLLKAVQNKMDGSMLALSGSVILALSLIYDILIHHGVFEPPYITQYGTAAFVFLQSQVVAKRFAKAFEAVQNMRKNLQIEVDRQTAEIRSLMDHVPMGIFMIEKDLTIQKGYSQHLENIYDIGNVEGKPVLETMFRDSDLSQERLSIVSSTLVAAVGEPSIVWDMNSAQLPLEYSRRDRSAAAQIIEVEWHPVVNKQDVIERILVTTRNVTRMRELQSQAARSELDISLLTEMVQADPKGLSRFWIEADRTMRLIQEWLKSKSNPRITNAELSRVARDLHTLKGVARALSMRKLTGSIHDAETVWPRASWSLNPERQQCLEFMINLFYSYWEIYRNRLASNDPRTERLAISKAAIDELERSFREKPNELSDAVRNLLCRHVYASMGDLCRELQNAAADLAKSLDKVKTNVMSEGPRLFLTEGLHHKLRGALLHLVGNAMDHGIESIDERLAKGKGSDASIVLNWWVEDEWVRLSVHDDGRGLNLVTIREKAVNQGLLSPKSRLSAREINACLFREGFSTTKVLTQISGRGIGMTAAQSTFEELGGQLQLALPADIFEEGYVPFRLLARIPLSIFIRMP